MMDSSHDSDMDNAVQALRTQLGDAQVKLAQDTSFWSDDASVAAQQGSLNQYAAKIDDLNTRLRGQVVDGSLSFESWKSIAQTTGDGIGAVAGYSIGWKNLWSDVVAKTGSDISTTVSTAVDKVENLSPWYLAAGIAVLVLVLAIKVT